MAIVCRRWYCMAKIAFQRHTCISSSALRASTNIAILTRANYSVFACKYFMKRSSPRVAVAAATLSMFCKRGIFVQISQTPNVLSQKFLPTGYKILPTDGGDTNNAKTLDISSYKDAMDKSGLARELFVIEGIKNVFMTNDYVTVTVDDTAKWPDAQGKVVGTINDYLLSNKPVLEGTFDINQQFENDSNYDDEDDEVVAIIRELIDTRIRPNVQYDGGDVVYKGFDHESGTLSLQLVGACKGCASSQDTLHNGIERMLRFYVPEVSCVEEFVDEEQDNLKTINERAFEKVQQKLDQEKNSTTSPTV